MKRVLVVGLGRFGRAVAEELTAAGGEVIAVDTDMTLVEAVRDRVAVAAQVDSVEADAIRAIGAAEVDAAVVAIGEDFAAEVLSVAILRELGIPEVVARAHTDRERRILTLVGATRVVSVEVEMGHRLARSLLTEHVVEHVSLGHGASVIFWTADDRVVGRRLDPAELASRWHLKLIGVRSGGADRMELDPGAGYVVRDGDVLVLAGPDARIAAFTR